MKRFVIAAFFAAALGTPLLAQPIPLRSGVGIGPPPVPLLMPTPPTAVPVPNPPPVPPMPTYSGPPGPVVVFQKSGGTLVGLHGYYPYDTGNYLLGDGIVSRQAGFFTMVYPGGNFPPAASAEPVEELPIYTPPTRFKHRLFHR